MDGQVRARKWTYFGLFAVSLATVMYEILLTRIFSVTMWYHFAFMAISLAMFGLTAGGLAVYRNPQHYEGRSLKRQLALSSFFFGLWALASFLIHLLIPFIPQTSVIGVASLATTYVITAVPFAFSGICVCAALTKFPGQVSKLYGADLAGAATGCVLLIPVLRAVDAPTAVVLVAVLGTAAATVFALDGRLVRLVYVTVAASVLLAGFGAVNALLAREQTPLLRLKWIKGSQEPPPLYEKWNCFSRITVRLPPSWRAPFGWGLSPAYRPDREVRQLELRIDASATTVLTQYHGDDGLIEYLKYDVINLVHHIRPHSKVLVVGSGGGRDVLSAKAFRQRSIVAVEINPDIIEASNGRFGDFTGHLDRYPKIAFINAEARSYIAGSPEQFDIIQLSLTDTWAATVAGAFVFTETALYTVEAWQTFLERLTPGGVLTVSRWYLREFPHEMYRLAGLASTALRRLGIDEPREHVMIVRCMKRLLVTGRTVEEPDGVGVILVARERFSPEDVETIRRIARQMQFEVVFDPRFSADPIFSRLITSQDVERVAKQLPLDVTPPTDDHPFFFHMLRLKDLLKPTVWDEGHTSFNLSAVVVLGTLLVLVFGLTTLCVYIPLRKLSGTETLRSAVPHLIYFAAIGFGFMLVEVSQIQRLTVFLGHPTYGLSVVLFTLLLSGGLGSYSTKAIDQRTPRVARLFLLVGVVAVVGALTPFALHASQAAPTAHKALLAVGMLLPLGLVMGTAFPLGLKLASVRSDSLTPWFWGINGATSVCGSVLAVAIALSLGISASFWTGAACYAIAAGAFAWAAGAAQRRVLTLSRRGPVRPAKEADTCDPR